MKRTKLVYATRQEDIREKVAETLKKYHIPEEDVLDVRYQVKDSNQSALILYTVPDQGGTH